MKKVAIDITTLSDQYKDRGIGVYTYNLVSHLIKDKSFDWHLIGFRDSLNRFKADGVKFYSLGEVRLSTPRNIIFFKKGYLPIIKQIRPDLYFAPHFERGLPIGICKTVVTVHDVSPYLFNKYSMKGPIVNFLKGLFYRYNLSRAKQADQIITISNFIKGEIAKVGFDESKIKVSYLALSKNFDLGVLDQIRNRGKVLRKYKIAKPYILYYGGLESNKNVNQLLKAFLLLREKKDIRLVLRDKNLYKMGSRVYTKSAEAGKIARLINNLKISDLVLLPKFIEWKDLPILCGEAEVFVHLSSYEGFGLAVLEAMSAGCPVIIANRSCYPEVFGDAAILVDPDDTKEVAAKILEVIEDKELQKELIQKGLKRVKRYSWDKAAEGTLEVFKSLIAN
jgi:glycosyltransferase involved in cell wall biosynthesis